MILRELIDASMGCYHFGKYHASFLLALCAVDATAKKRYPGERSTARRFKDFVRENIPAAGAPKEWWVAVEMPDDISTLPKNSDGDPDIPQVGDDFQEHAGKPRLVRIEGVIYHAFRCALSHDASLPDVELLPPTPTGTLKVSVDTRVRVSADIIGMLLHILTTCPENKDVLQRIR